MKVAIVGKGKAGLALRTALTEKGIVPIWCWSRTDNVELVSLPTVDVILIAVADRAIAEVAKRLANRAGAMTEIWLHLSGFHEGTHCRVDENIPRASGSFHPLCALNSAKGILQHLQGCIAGVDGEPEAVACATSLASELAMVPVHLKPGSKKLYHAAAVTVAGHVTALFDRATKALLHCGFEEEASQKALLELLRTTVDNLKSGPPKNVMTGPVARGDTHVTEAHIQALGAVDPPLANVYEHLVTLALELHEETEKSQN